MKRGISLLLVLFIFLGINKVNALELTEQEYESYNITRAYVVGDYIFDLSKHNPTLKDFLLAAQSLPKGEVSIIEIKIAENLDGELVREYRELLDSKTLDSFPKLDVKYIYQSEIMPENPESEKKIIIGESTLAKPVLAIDEETNELTSMVIYENEKQNHYFIVKNIYEDYLTEEFLAEIENIEDYCLDYSCFGFEIYSVSNGEYTFVNKLNIDELRVIMIVPMLAIEMEENSTKTFAVKVFLDSPSEGLKYSDYSDPFTVTSIDVDTNYVIPDLNISLGKYDYIDGIYNYKVNIDFSDYCGEPFDPDTCDVLSMIFEYKNVDKGFKMLYPPTNQLEIELEPNEDVNYYIEVLVPNEDESYYYLVKSNQLSITVPETPNSEIPAVVLNESVELVSKDEENWTETYKVTYELSNELKTYCENNSCTNVGVTLFETYDSEIYEALDTKVLNNDFTIEIDDYAEVTVIAKAYIETTEGKIYGISSNEITITPTGAEE